MSISQAEQLSKVQLVDYFVIMVMAALWAFIPTDGIALITQWFFHKVVQVSLFFYKFKISEVNLHKVKSCIFLAHLAKGKVSFCHHLASVVR